MVEMHLSEIVNWISFAEGYFRWWIVTYINHARKLNAMHDIMLT